MRTLIMTTVAATLLVACSRDASRRSTTVQPTREVQPVSGIEPPTGTSEGGLVAPVGRDPEAARADTSPGSPAATGTVIGAGLTDDLQLAQRIESALSAGGNLDVGVGPRLSVEVNRGFVTLRGTVENEADRVAAGDMIAKIDGVRGVRNLVEVVPPAGEQQR